MRQAESAQTRQQPHQPRLYIMRILADSAPSPHAARSKEVEADAADSRVRMSEIFGLLYGLAPERRRRPEASKRHSFAHLEHIHLGVALACLLAKSLLLL